LCVDGRLCQSIVDQDGVVALSEPSVTGCGRGKLLVKEGTEEAMAGAMVRTIVQAESTTAGTR
jgi:hypothetical protein